MRNYFSVCTASFLLCYNATCTLEYVVFGVFGRYFSVTWPAQGKICGKNVTKSFKMSINSSIFTEYFLTDFSVYKQCEECRRNMNLSTVTVELIHVGPSLFNPRALVRPICTFRDNFWAPRNYSFRRVVVVWGEGGIRPNCKVFLLFFCTFPYYQKEKTLSLKIKGVDALRAIHKS